MSILRVSMWGVGMRALVIIVSSCNHITIFVRVDEMNSAFCPCPSVQASVGTERVMRRQLGHRTLFEGKGLRVAMSVFTRDWEAFTQDELDDVW